MKNPTRVAKNEYQKEFIKLFDGMCGKHSRYEVWQDFVLLTAIEISNAVDIVHREERNETYRSVVGKYTEKERAPFAAMLAQIVMGMEADPGQDFHGELYMNLNLGNSHAGQFFTPYDVCKMMAKITCADIADKIKAQGWVGVNDPTCGAGATLVAFANLCREEGVNFQQYCLFTAQDIDYTVACMCYIQLSLMGCAGYVVVGNTITQPSTSIDPRGLIPVDNGNVWYTPMYFSAPWHFRRVWTQMEMMFPNVVEMPAEDAPVDSVSPEPEIRPAILPEPEAPQTAIQEAVVLNMTETGQLTLF